MAGCSDKRFENMLFAYELGILSEEETKEFELHVLECESCLEEIKKFKEAALHIRNDEPTREVIRTIDSETGDNRAIDGRRKKSWRTFVPIAAAAALILMLVLQPWQIEIRPTQDAVAAENRLVILPFEQLADKTDSTGLARIVLNLLITDLAESHYIQVVSGQQLADILIQLDIDDTTGIDNNQAVEIAQKAGASWILSGSILQEKPPIILTYKIVEVKSGDIISTHRIDGDTASTVFSVIDNLSASIKSGLPIPDAALHESDRSIADFTTYSEDAYRYYLDGLEYYQKRYYPEARRSFEQVLEHDSTFAMAYYYLSYLKDPRLADQAVAFIDHASEKDGYYIRQLIATRERNMELKESILMSLLERYPNEKYALNLLGNSKYYQGKFEEAISYYERALKLDPRYRQVFDPLSFAYNKLGEFDKAMQINSGYISVAPDEPNPYDSRGALFAQNGRLDSSIVSYKKALEIKPDFESSLEELGVMYVLDEKYDSAAVYFHKIASAENKKERSKGRYYLALIPLYQGEMRQALEVMDDCLAADRLEGAESEQGYKFIIKALIYEGLNITDSAFYEMEKSFEFYRSNYHLYYSMMAQNGEIARARQELEHLKDSLSESEDFMFQYYLTSGNIDLLEGNVEPAIDNLEKAANMAKILPVVYSLGQAYVRGGQYDKAVEILKERLAIYDSYRVCRPIWSVKMIYFLGLAYEGAGDNEKAIAQYEKFLEIWKDADPGIAEVIDAQRRLVRLSHKS